MYHSYCFNCLWLIFKVKIIHVHTNSANNRMKVNDSVISLLNMHNAILQKTTKPIEQHFIQDCGSAILPQDLPSWASYWCPHSQLISLGAFHFMFVVLGMPTPSSNLEEQFFIKCEIRYSVNEALSRIWWLIVNLWYVLCLNPLIGLHRVKSDFGLPLRARLYWLECSACLAV